MKYYVLGLWAAGGGSIDTTRERHSVEQKLAAAENATRLPAQK